MKPDEIRALIQNPVMVAGKCGHHFHEECTSCNTSNEWTDAELRRLRTALRELLAEVERLESRIRVLEIEANGIMDVYSPDAKPVSIFDLPPATDLGEQSIGDGQ